MKPHKTLKPQTLQCLLAIAIYSISFSSNALSRMGTAVITDAEGTPCFSIPEDSETKAGVPLHGMTISELPDGSSDKIPLAVWSFRETDHDSPPILMPKECILYGKIPLHTTQRTLIPLDLLKVYSVFIRARHDGSSMLGYTGQFCIKPAGSGRTIVQAISEDPRLGESRYGGCAK